ncbi:MAG: hypothetical protein K2Y22_02300 [Candidatus Obscuribacterales bacterium]|nr:hypothetical protein [Candidatus Obscuribacterales bacterium]
MQGTINYNVCLIGLMSFFTLVTTQVDAKADFASPVSTEDIKPGQSIAIENSTHIPISIVKVLRDCRIVCIGEFHGSKEIPEFVDSLAGQLSDDGSDLIVGLELPRDHQKFIDEYMKTGDEEILKSMPIFNCPVQDGRGSTAMASLIKHLRTMPAIKVIAFDPISAKNPQDRDNSMAEFLAKQLQSAPNKRLLILCGNVHAANRVGMSFDRTFCPMANHLAQLRPDDRIYTIVAKFQNGTTWSLTPNNKGGPVVHKRKPCSIEHGASDCYFLPYKQSTNGYNAELFIRTLSLSEPYWLSRSEDAQAPEDGIQGYNRHLERVTPPAVPPLQSVTAKHATAQQSLHQLYRDDQESRKQFQTTTSFTKENPNKSNDQSKP